MAKKPRNYAATESTLLQNRKTRLDIRLLTARVRLLEKAIKRLDKMLGYPPR